MTTPSIRTRFAPSPTGELHVGSLRTALYNYLYAKQNNGQFVLRIEDTDQQRLVAGATDRLYSTLQLFGLTPDESFAQPGDYGPYVQSQRLELYKKFVQQLLNNQQAYYAFDTPDELVAMREEQQAQKMPPKYDRRALALTKEQINEKFEAGEPYVIRMKVPDGTTTFNDLIRGKITIANETIDDQILLKSDGFPTYHLAVVVDDYLMKISHVIRGEEWIPSTPKHVLLYQMFGWEMPTFAHLPLLTNEKKAKLSKRHGDVSVEDFIHKGILPECLLNFVALLGWNPGTDKELFSLEELITTFDLHKVQKGSAVFDRTKLGWMNSQYIRQLPLDTLAQHAGAFLQPLETQTNILLPHEQVLNLFHERLESLSELSNKAAFLYSLPDYDANILIFKKSDKATAYQALTASLAFIQNHTFTTATALREAFDQYRESLGLSRAELFWPFRVALSGNEQSPDAFEIALVLGKSESLKRLKQAQSMLDQIK